ncbi:MAG: polysaccharide biosynthesis C-terminal domain-containing protein, partial [Candidatus Omnitrophica bacterium]|nr:polysaccharide biosynthesis C-terminal domain-containing protein [Candidatus Omnitrophota bacterium]
YIINCAIILSSLLGSALMPVFSELEAKGEIATLIKAYLKSTKYLAMVVIPVFIFLFVASSRIMFMWMGLGYEKASLIIQILAIAWMFRTIVQSAESLSIAINKPQLLAAPAVLITLLNITLSIVLIKKFGFYGAAWGTALAVNIGAFYFMVRLHKSLKVPVWRIFGAVTPYLLSAIFAGMVIYGTDKILMLFNLDLSRFSAMILLFIQALIFNGVYLGIIYFARLLDVYDSEFIELKFPKVYSMIKFLLPRGRRS